MPICQSIANPPIRNRPENPGGTRTTQEAGTDTDLHNQAKSGSSRKSQNAVLIT